MRKNNYSSGYSNSADNESNKNKVCAEDVNMAPENSQIDDEMGEESFMSQTDNGRKSYSEVDGDGFNQMQSDGRKGISRKRKQTKKSKVKQEKAAKITKRNIEEHQSNNYVYNRETVAQFTKYRSMKIAKEREDLVESRSLGMKVSLFCGLTATQIQDRIQQDIDAITTAIDSSDM